MGAFTLDIGGVFAGLSAIVGLVVWLVRLEGRINLLAAQATNTDKRIDGLEERILSQLDRIESRLDALVGRKIERA